MIYFIRFNGFVKIGFSNNPNKRIASLQVGLPIEVEVLNISKGSRADEKSLHKLFINSKAKGEWFEFTDDIKEYIKSLNDIKWKFGYGEQEKVTMPIRRMYIDSGMTYEVIADNLGVTKGAVQKMIGRATNGSITIHKLTDLAEGMNHRFEYRFVAK